MSVLPAPSADSEIKNPEVISVTRSEDQLALSLMIPATLLYFRGHFPNFPILPGIVQLDWAVQYSREHFDLGAISPTTIRIKFIWQNIWTDCSGSRQRFRTSRSLISDINTVFASSEAAHHSRFQNRNSGVCLSTMKRRPHDFIYALVFWKCGQRRCNSGSAATQSTPEMPVEEIPASRLAAIFEDE